MEYWYLAPVILAILLFLLVGTVFEKRIERTIRQFIERRLGGSPGQQPGLGGCPGMPSTGCVLPPSDVAARGAIPPPLPGSAFPAFPNTLTCRSKSAVDIANRLKAEVNSV